MKNYSSGKRFRIGRVGFRTPRLFIARAIRKILNRKNRIFKKRFFNKTVLKGGRDERGSRKRTF